MHPIPDGTRFPSKTKAYGRKTRYEIATSYDKGKRSTVFPADQKTRGGEQWAYDTREAAAKQARFYNLKRAESLVAWIPTAPHDYYESRAHELKEQGEYLAASIAFEYARNACGDQKTRILLERCAQHYRDLDDKRYNEAYPNG